MLRDHVVERDPASGLISLLGGKWTTYRLMARDAVNEVFHDIDVSDENEYLNVTPVSQTEDFTLAVLKISSLIFGKNFIRYMVLRRMFANIWRRNMEAVL
jgi:glycerol-3-phosphate dehydrogenase